MCWGRNSVGQLGDGTATFPYKPVHVSGLARGVAAISAGGSHTCALMLTGGVKCWGRNSFGQLGDGTTTDRTTPVDVAGLPAGVKAIAAGVGRTCALTSVGGVKCWGDNQYGQLGDGTTEERHAPVDVAGLTHGVKAIEVGDGHTCALTNAGGVKCWGYNPDGQLGDGTKADRHAPVDVLGLTAGVSAVVAGGGHTCARTNAGGVLCWGRGDAGQLGNGRHRCRAACRSSRPVRVSGLARGVAAIAVGGLHSCALAKAGSIRCWGYNLWGELGDGKVTTRYTPVAVVGFGAVMCVVPNVLERPLALAKAQIGSAHCRVGKVTQARSSERKNTVVGQSPRAGKHLRRGAKVNLKVSRGPS